MGCHPNHYSDRLLAIDSRMEGTIHLRNAPHPLQLTDVQWAPGNEILVWRETRAGHGVLVFQSAPDSNPRDLTKEGSVAADLGYGGGDFTAGRDAVFFAAAGCLYRQSLREGESLAITPQGGRIASPAVSPSGRHLIYIHSIRDVDSLCVVDSEGISPPKTLTRGHDFYMQPCWHPEGSQLAWIAWDHPRMPWQGTALCRGRLLFESPVPRLQEEEVVAGHSSGETAVFQPSFSPDGRYLAYVSDEGGWFDLYCVDLSNGRHHRLVGMEAELGMPAWIQGLRTYAWQNDGAGLFLLSLKDSVVTLHHYDFAANRVRPVSTGWPPYTSLKQISVCPITNRVATIASSGLRADCILTMDEAGKPRVWRSSSRPPSDRGSQPQLLQWPIQGKPGEGASPPGESSICHGLYYPPTDPMAHKGDLPPALIKIHGGPTSQYLADYHADTQFFTTLGFAVLEVNYRGSSGYGRLYRESLRGQWGVLDVEDILGAASYLEEQRLAHPGRLALLGKSAGGFTLLLTLIARPGRFRAGLCLYPVYDLTSLASQTHKFERHYLDWLIGPLPQNAPLYRRRSPVFAADRIQDPLAVFHGEEDPVVPCDQSQAVVDSLARRGIPHLYRRYPGEGHGWKREETVDNYYRAAQSFLSLWVLSC